MSFRGTVSNQPVTAPLRWLVDAGCNLTPDLAEKLLQGLFTSPSTILMAAVNGFLLNMVAYRLSGDTVFVCYIAFDAALVATRLLLFVYRRRDFARARHISSDCYLLACIAWCAVQGAMGFTAMRSGIASVQIISAMTAVGLIGPICMRNFAAPRYAFTMIGLVLGPLVCGAALSGNHWLLILVLQTPAFLLGAVRMLGRFQKLTIDTLRAERDSEERARRDALTGLLNRSGLSEAIKSDDQDRRARSIFFYLDLDGFKSINDTYGHQAGDAVLAAVAGRLLSFVRSDDIVARLGGDEFMIVARHLSPPEGDLYASEIIREIAGTPYSLKGLQPLCLGISVGFACCPDDGHLSEELSQRADSALYEAKAAGKGVHRRYKHRERRMADLSAMSIEAAVS